MSNESTVTRLNQKLENIRYNLRVHKVKETIDMGNGIKDHLCVIKHNTKLELKTGYYRQFRNNYNSDEGEKVVKSLLEIPFIRHVISLYKIKVLHSSKFYFVDYDNTFFYYDLEVMKFPLHPDMYKNSMKKYGLTEFSYVVKPFLPHSIGIGSPCLITEDNVDGEVDVEFYEYRVIREKDGLCCPMIQC